MSHSVSGQWRRPGRTNGERLLPGARALRLLAGILLIAALIVYFVYDN